MANPEQVPLDPDTIRLIRMQGEPIMTDAWVFPDYAFMTQVAGVMADVRASNHEYDPLIVVPHAIVVRGVGRSAITLAMESKAYRKAAGDPDALEVLRNEFVDSTNTELQSQGLSCHLT
jgi:hypothetical protein